MNHLKGKSEVMDTHASVLGDISAPRPTPLTDAAWKLATEKWPGDRGIDPWTLARQFERKLSQAQSELRREKHAYDAAVKSHQEYIWSIQSAIVATVGGTVDGQPTHE